ncbi:MAG: hypothetical protein DRQ47_01905 [Gammaproteobacteria bacterium]|nr:MAG: hypothetical protein DRQ47_01905 [Gammaproteobacteria bacterium]
MRATEFLNEGNDKSPSDVEKNHPEVYKFLQGITGPQSIQQAKVEAFDLGKTHYVVLTMQPSAGLGNTKAVLKGKGIDFEFDDTMNTVKGIQPGFEFTIDEDHIYDNKKAIWTFELPITSIEEDASDNHSVWDVYCSHNFWSGSRYEQGWRPVHVIAASKEQAKEIVVNNIDKVEELFRSKYMRKGSGRIRLIRAKEMYHIKPERLGKVEPTMLISGEAMNSDGEMIKVNLNDDKTIQEADRLSDAEKAANRKYNAQPHVSGIQDRGGFETMDWPKKKKKKKFNLDTAMGDFMDAPRGRSSREVDWDDGDRGLSNRDRNK